MRDGWDGAAAHVPFVNLKHDGKWTDVIRPLSVTE